MATSFQHIRKSNDVALDIRLRIYQRVAHSRLSRQVNYTIERVRSEARLDSLGIS
jgi:hypothetical protein